MRSFYIDPDLDEGLKVVKDRFGIPESEQIRRAIRYWLAHYEGKFRPPPEPARKVARKRRVVKKK